MSELGETLAAERRRAGRSIAEVEAATRIRGRLIEALEKGEWERLPSPAYVKGYIQSYARYLEIPAEPLLELYRRDIGRPAGSEPRERRVPPRVPKREDLHLIPMRTALIIAAVLAAGALTVWAAVRLLSPPQSTGPGPLPVTSTETATPTGTPEATATGVLATGGALPGVVDAPDPGSAGTLSAPIGAEFELKVTVKRGEASWTIVKVDGLRAYEGMMTDGDSKTWLVKSEASVGMGRPSATTVYRNGTQVTDKPVTVGKVPTIILTAEQ